MEGDQGLAAGVSARLSDRELKRFGITVSIPLALLAGLGVWRGHWVVPVILGTLAVGLGGLVLVAPRLLAPVHTVWMAGAHALGRFNTRILMGLVYFLIMTPMGMVMRLLGRDPLDRQLHDRPSYWVAHTPPPDPRGAMERRF